MFQYPVKIKASAMYAGNWTIIKVMGDQAMSYRTKDIYNGYQGIAMLDFNIEN